MKTKTLSLAEALPIEQARVREILGHYKGICPPGAIGSAMIEASLAAADKAAASGDVLAMLHAFTDLQEIDG